MTYRAIIAAGVLVLAGCGHTDDPAQPRAANEPQVAQTCEFRAALRGIRDILSQVEGERSHAQRLALLRGHEARIDEIAREAGHVPAAMSGNAAIDCHRVAAIAYSAKIALAGDAAAAAAARAELSAQADLGLARCDMVRADPQQARLMDQRSCDLFALYRDAAVPEAAAYANWALTHPPPGAGAPALDPAALDAARQRYVEFESAARQWVTSSDQNAPRWRYLQRISCVMSFSNDALVRASGQAHPEAATSMSLAADAARAQAIAKLGYTDGAQFERDCTSEAGVQF